MSEQALELIEKAQKITFLTGASVSVPSGIPDYRSVDGAYQGLESPEYLLSHRCLVNEPNKFYQFVKRFYYPEAKPNGIHLKMAALEKTKKQVEIVTQNIDQLHHLARSKNVINFHGNLYSCTCRTCQQAISVKEYLVNQYHQECGGQIRPDIVLYEEELPEITINSAVAAVAVADLLVIVGTSFKVEPFSQLIYQKKVDAPVIVVNREAIHLPVPHLLVQRDALPFFDKI